MVASDVSLVDSSITGNQASTSGGGVFLNQSLFNCTSCDRGTAGGGDANTPEDVAISGGGPTCSGLGDGGDVSCDADGCE